MRMIGSEGRVIVARHGRNKIGAIKMKSCLRNFHGRVGHLCFADHGSGSPPSDLMLTYIYSTTKQDSEQVQLARLTRGA